MHFGGWQEHAELFAISLDVPTRYSPLSAKQPGGAQQGIELKSKHLSSSRNYVPITY
jgi:hypothetical protein